MFKDAQYRCTTLEFCGYIAQINGKLILFYKNIKRFGVVEINEKSAKNSKGFSRGRDSKARHSFQHQHSRTESP